MSKTPKNGEIKPSKKTAFLPLSKEEERRFKLTGWPDWKKPADPLPIDDVISGMIDPKGRQTKLLSPERLKKYNIPCPYKAAREGIIQAAANANFEVEKEQMIRDRNNRAKAFIRDAVGTSTALSKLLERRVLYDFAPSLERGAGRIHIENMSTKLLEANNAFQSVEAAIPALNTLAELAKAECERLPTTTKAKKVAETAFAEWLGFTWSDLTGQASIVAEQFTKFVEAARNSLSDDDETSWEFQTRNALDRAKKRGSWDGFDRRKEGDLSPSTTRITPEDAKELKRERDKRWEENLQIVKTIANSKDHPQQYFAKKLLDRWSGPDFKALAFERLRSRLDE
jgi:hypothetical protein